MIIRWRGEPTDKTLTAALGEGLESAMVLGWRKDGEMYLSFGNAPGPEVLWLLAMAQTLLLEISKTEAHAQAHR